MLALDAVATRDWLYSEIEFLGHTTGAAEEEALRFHASLLSGCKQIRLLGVRTFRGG